MKYKLTEPELIASFAKQVFVKRILTLVIPTTLFLAITGVMINILGPLHPYRLAMNTGAIVILISSLVLLRSNKLVKSVHVMLGGLP